MDNSNGTVQQGGVGKRTTFKLQNLIIDCIPAEFKAYLNPAQLRILRELIFYPISNRCIRLHHQPNYMHLQTWGKTRTFLFACFYDLFYLQSRMLNPLCKKNDTISAV